MYVNGKMRPTETIPGMTGGRIKKERVNSTMIYCKNFCKCHIVSPNTTIINKRNILSILTLDYQKK
jgi:hypothetical protein